MQLISTSVTLIALLLTPITVTGRSILLGSDQSPILSPADDVFPVPGDNPLLFCNDPSSDILTIDKVDLSPNPPVPGKILTINAKGTLAQDVEKGAKVHLEVKYGLIRLINQEADLCDEIKNVDMSCPLNKGPVALTKDVDMPNTIPPGKYTVRADVYSVDKEKITCLEASVTFN